MADEKTVAANPKRAIAVLDKGGVLIERIANPSDAQWEAAAAHCRFPNGFDNALKRYRLIEWRQGRWRFEPIVHAKDAGAENMADVPNVTAAVVRTILALAGNTNLSTDDLQTMHDYVQTLDAQG